MKMTRACISWGDEMTHKSESDSPDSELIRRLDTLEMMFARLLAVMSVRLNTWQSDAAFKATGQRELTASEAFILAQIRERLGDKQV